MTQPHSVNPLLSFDEALCPEDGKMEWERLLMAACSYVAMNAHTSCMCTSVYKEEPTGVLYTNESKDQYLDIYVVLIACSTLSALNVISL